MNTQREALNRIALPNTLSSAEEAQSNQTQSGDQRRMQMETHKDWGDAGAAPPACAAPGAAELAKELHFLLSLTKESFSQGLKNKK